MDWAKIFARNLECVRIARGYTRENLALDAGVSISYLWSLKKGTSSATFQMAGKLAGTLKVELWILLRPDLVVESVTDEMDELIEGYASPPVLKLKQTQKSKRKLRP